MPVAEPSSQPPRSKRVCVLGDAAHCKEKAAQHKLPFLTVNDLQRLHKNKKFIRRVALSFDAFIASPALINQIPQLLWRGLYTAGKFPIPANRDLRLIDQAMAVQFG